MLAASASAAKLTKGPYLIYNGAADQMRMLWQLDTSSNCTVAWGATNSYELGTASGTAGSGNLYTQTLTKLPAGTRIYYALTVGSSVTKGSFFSALPSTATKLQFLVFGDTRTQVTELNQVTGAMNAAIQADPNWQTFALHMGDWVNADAESNWSSEFFASSGADTRRLIGQLPVQGCIGNHEGGGNVYRRYWPYPYVNSSYFYWSFDYGPAHVVIIDQYDTSGGPSDAQLSWIDADLAATKKEWKFLVFHEPGWTTGEHGPNMRVRDRIQPLCKARGVDVCFSGHNHCYARYEVNGVEHITSGGGGAPLYAINPDPAYYKAAEATFQFCEVRINGRTLDFAARRTDGSLLDSFQIVHARPHLTMSKVWQLFN